jgi:hypothetical protein
VKAGASGSRLAGPRCGNAPERPTQLGIGWCQASSGAKAPLACEDRQLEGRARTSKRLQKSASDDRDREKRAPAGNGERGRRSSSRGIPKGPAGVQRRRERAARRPSREAREDRSRTSERALRGEGPRSMEGTLDRFPVRIVHAGGSRRSWRPARERKERELHGLRTGGDRGVRGTALTRRSGKTTPAAVKSRRGATWGPTEATRAAVKQTGSPEADAQASDRSEADEVRVLVRRREMADTGPTHRASRRSRQPQGESTARRWLRGSPTSC